MRSQHINVTESSSDVRMNHQIDLMNVPQSCVSVPPRFIQAAHRIELLSNPASYLKNYCAFLLDTGDYHIGQGCRMQQHALSQELMLAGQGMDVESTGSCAPGMLLYSIV